MFLDLLAVLKNPEWIAVGLWGTLRLSVATLVLAPLLGLLLCFARLSFRGVGSLVLRAYIDAIRAVPTIVLLFWIFFALPGLLNIKLDPFSAATITLTLQYGAFFSEVFRGGVSSVGRGQWDAASAVGMSLSKKLKYVVIPQALPGMLPSLFSHLIDLVKATSLASAITYADIMYEGLRVSADTFRPVEALTVVALVYYFIALFLGAARASLERRYARR